MVILTCIGSSIATLKKTLPKHGLVERDFRPAELVFRNITAEYDNMLPLIDAFTGSSDQFSRIQHSSETIVNITQEGSKSIQGTAMGLMDSIEIYKPMQEWATKVQTVIEALEKKKPLFDAGQSAAILTQLKAQRESANHLSQVMLGNIAATVHLGLRPGPIAKPGVDKLDAAIQKWS